MTPEEFRNEMQKIQIHYAGDREEVHIEMDALMTKLLEKLGYGDGVQIFKDQEKWYA